MKLSISESEFFSSVRAGDVSAVKQALRPEPYLVDFQDEIGKTPLWLAVENGQMEMVEVLIAHGASTEITDQDGCSLLHLVIKEWLDSYGSSRESFIEMVNFLLKLGIDIDATDRKGISCLHNAAVLGDKEIASFLLEKGANVDLRSEEGFTPFLWTLYAAHVWERDIPKYLEMLESLVKAGADVNAITSKGETALDLAKIWNSRPQFIKFLKEHGAR